ncbi:hypothetical protein EDB84DRAFT_1263444 [Lactarius hengduanensis]|nr:hypothetical protein EDB84DRAFT_1263444 [Lactarius hengduanensis]
MDPRGSSPHPLDTVTIVPNHRHDSRVENSALIQSSSPRTQRLQLSQPAQPEGPVSLQLSAISSDQYNLQHNNNRHVRDLPLSGFNQAPISESSSGHSGAPLSSIESSRLSSQSSPYHGSLNPQAHRPRTYNQVFHSTSDLAAHHGIPESLPPPPRTTPRSSEPDPIPDFSLSSLCSNYLTMLSSNKTSEQTPTITESDTSAAHQMSVDNEAAAQAIASALSASPDFFNPSSFLTSPVSPWEDDLLTTPAFEAGMGMTPDIFTSPALTDFGGEFGGDHDHMPSLFGPSGYEGYDDAKVNFGGALGPSDLPLPVPDMDQMYTISPGTPALDTPAIQPFNFDGPSNLGRRTSPTGTRKNITPETLVPYDAPIQTRKYRTPSATSRKELPVTFARKRARTQGPDEEDDAAAGPTVSEEDAIQAKRLQNTLAARRSRKRKLEYQRELEDAIEAERKDKETWRARALILEALLRDKGHEVPQMSEA